MTRLLQVFFACFCAWRQSNAFVPTQRSSLKSHSPSFLQHRQNSHNVLFQQRRFQDFRSYNGTSFAPPGRREEWSPSSSVLPRPEDNMSPYSPPPPEFSYGPSPMQQQQRRDVPPPPFRRPGGEEEDWLADTRRRNNRGSSWGKPDFGAPSYAPVVKEFARSSNSSATADRTNNDINATRFHPVHYSQDWWAEHPRSLKLDLPDGRGRSNAPRMFGEEARDGRYAGPYDTNGRDAYREDFYPYGRDERRDEQSYSRDFYNQRNDNRAAVFEQWRDKNPLSAPQQRRREQGMSYPRQANGPFRRGSPPSVFEQFSERVTSPQNYDRDYERNFNVRGPPTDRYQPVPLSERRRQGISRTTRDGRTYDQGGDRTLPLSSNARRLSASRSDRFDERNSLSYQDNARSGNRGDRRTSSFAPVLLNDKLRQQDNISRRGYDDWSQTSNNNNNRGRRGNRRADSFMENDFSSERGGTLARRRRSPGYLPMRRDDEGWSVRGSSSMMNRGAGYGSSSSFSYERGVSPYYNQGSYSYERNFSPYYNENMNTGRGYNGRMSSRYREGRLDGGWTSGSQHMQSNGLRQDMSRVGRDRAFSYNGGNSSSLMPYRGGSIYNNNDDFYGNGMGYSSGGYQSPSYYGDSYGNGRGFSPYYHSGRNERPHFSPFNPRGDLMTSSVGYYPGGNDWTSPYSQWGNNWMYPSNGYAYERGSFSPEFNRRHGMMSSSRNAFSGVGVRGSSTPYYSNQSGAASLASRRFQRNRSDGWSERKPASLKRDLSDVSRNMGGILDDTPFSFRD